MRTGVDGRDGVARKNFAQRSRDLIGTEAFDGIALDRVLHRPAVTVEIGVQPARRRALGRGLRQRMQATDDAARVFVGAAINVMRIGHEIDIDGGLFLVPRRDPVGAQFDRIEADGQNQVGFAHMRHVDFVDHRAQAGGARAQRVVFGHDTLGLVGGDKRHAPRFDEALQLALGAVDLHADADQRERPPRFLQQRLDRRAVLAPRQRAHRHRRETPRFGLLRAGDVGRHVESARDRASRSAQSRALCAPGRTHFSARSSSSI